MSWGDNFTSGFQVTSNLRERKKDRELRKQEQEAERQLRQQALDNQIAQFDRNFTRQTGRDVAEDFRSDRGFNQQVSARGEDVAFRGDRAKASDSQFDRSAQQRAGEFAIQDLRGAQASAQGQLNSAAKMLLAERQLEAEIAQGKDRNALTSRSIDVQKQIGMARNQMPLSPEDQQALQWAMENPQDPRANVIRQRLGQ